MGAAGGISVSEGSVRAVDDRPVRAGPPHQTIALEVEARQHVDRLMNDARTRPVIVITTRPSQTQPWIDPYEVRERLGDGPEILFLANDRAQRQFVRAMPAGFSLQWSNARIYWPNFSVLADGKRHPLVRDNEPDPVGRLRELYVSGPKFDLSNPGGKVERKPSELEYVDRLSALLGANARLTSERDKAKQRAERAERKVRGRPDRRTRQAERDGVAPERDLDREFRETITGVWLDLHVPDDRHRFPLRGYRLGRQFIASVEALPPEAARRLPRVCAVVLCGRALELGDFEPHQIGAGASAGSGVLTRSVDGAVAMRCRIGGSHRLHWWARRDTGIDLALAVHADSHEIPDS